MFHEANAEIWHDSTQRAQTVIWVVFIVAWLSGLVCIYFIHNGLVEQRIADVANRRKEVIREHIDIALALISQMRTQMESNIWQAENGQLWHPSATRIQPSDIVLDTYIADGILVDNPLQVTANGSLSGVGNILKISQETWREINAALSLSLPLGRGGMVTNNADFVWSYYTSKNHFMFIAPKVGFKDFHFDDALYELPFWQSAIPQHNPEHKIVLSKLYDDGAGQGYMISVSAPVFVNEVFRGVVSLDVGIATLRKALSRESLDGVSLLFDENGLYVASPNDFSIGEQLVNHATLTSHLGKFVAGEAALFYTLPILDRQLYFTHRVTRFENWQLILLSALGYALVFTFILLVVYLLIRLRTAIARTTYLATHDSLTNLLNRRAMREHSRLVFDLTDRHGGPLSIIMLDIDYFKKVNDTYGHDVGDEAIRTVADILRKRLRKSDLCSRIGGEEFLILLFNTSHENAGDLAEQLRHAIETTPVHKAQLRITISLGYVQRHADESYEALVKRSDEALYRAKHAGRNCAVFGAFEGTDTNHPGNPGGCLA